MTETPESASADSRLRRLEQHLARVRVLAWLAFLVGVGGIAWGWYAESKADVTIGRLWIAKDRQGRLRAMFGVSNDGVGLTMYDSTGQMRLDLGIAPGEVPGLLMLSPRGEPVATLNLIDGKVPTLRLTSPAETTRVELRPRSTGDVLVVKGPARPDTAIARRPRDVK
jgi:hypothetical protein